MSWGVSLEQVDSKTSNCKKTRNLLINKLQFVRAHLNTLPYACGTDAFLATFIFIIYCIVWFVVNPFGYQRTITTRDLGTGQPLVSTGKCTGANSNAWIGGLLALQTLFLVYGNYLAYQIRGIPNKYHNVSLCRAVGRKGGH